LCHAIIRCIYQFDRGLKSRLEETLSDIGQSRTRLSVRASGCKQPTHVFHNQPANVQTARDPNEIIEKPTAWIFKAVLMPCAAPRLAGRPARQQRHVPAYHAGPRQYLARREITDVRLFNDSPCKNAPLPTDPQTSVGFERSDGRVVEVGDVYTFPPGLLQAKVQSSCSGKQRDKRWV
jgi:hypothetical protein